MRSCNTARKLFSLTELLIVIAILAILVSLLQPSLKGMMDKTYRMECSKKLKVIAMAYGMYCDDHNGKTWSEDARGGSLSLTKSWGGATSLNDPWISSGVLYRDTYLLDAKDFHCPSSTRTSGKRYDFDLSNPPMYWVGDYFHRISNFSYAALSTNDDAHSGIEADSPRNGTQDHRFGYNAAYLNGSVLFIETIPLGSEWAGAWFKNIVDPQWVP